MVDLIKLLKTHKIDFSIFDPLYPSSSDPGAYLSYSATEINIEGNWQMTLGNHGWSGGIYQIPEEVILIQIKNLIEYQSGIEIEISEVIFFRKYSLVGEQINSQEISKIQALHSPSIKTSEIKLLEKDLDYFIRGKKSFLIENITSLISGEIQEFVPESDNSKYYEIWFYHSFDLKYIVLGRENYVIDIAKPEDKTILKAILSNKEFLAENEPEVNKIKQKIEFQFFSDCWVQIEKLIGKPLRCFLIEHGILRGWDVNNRHAVDGELVQDILEKEGLLD